MQGRWWKHVLKVELTGLSDDLARVGVSGRRATIIPSFRLEERGRLATALDQWGARGEGLQ